MTTPIQLTVEEFTDALVCLLGGGKAFEPGRKKTTKHREQRETSVFYTTSGFDLELFNA